MSDASDDHSYVAFLTHSSTLTSQIPSSNPANEALCILLSTVLFIIDSKLLRRQNPVIAFHRHFAPNFQLAATFFLPKEVINKLEGTLKIPQRVRSLASQFATAEGEIYNFTPMIGDL